MSHSRRAVLRRIDSKSREFELFSRERGDVGQRRRFMQVQQTLSVRAQRNVRALRSLRELSQRIRGSFVPVRFFRFFARVVYSG